MSASPPRIAIAIPAHDEEALIGRCLDAFATQSEAGEVTVVVLANNCSDGTSAEARRACGFDIRVIDHTFPPGERDAGHARRLAVEHAAALGDIVLTTDADCVPDPDWVAAHRRAFALGVDMVAGRVSADWEELRHHPAEALRIGALEWEYLGLMASAEALFDPRPHDPAPRHAQCCGANLGITSAMLRRVGGVPAVAVGEDWALLAAVDQVDGRIRFDPGPHVTASARTSGRADGGMANSLAARMSDDYLSDEQFAPADDLVFRWRSRAAARQAWSLGQDTFSIDGSQVPLDRALPTFGAAWGAVHLSPPRRQRPATLPRETKRLRELMRRDG